MILKIEYRVESNEGELTFPHMNVLPLWGYSIRELCVHPFKREGFGMAKNKKYEPTNPNKRKDKKPVITCPHCGSTNMEYVPDRRRIPSKWYIHVAAAVAVVVFFFFMPAFSVAFALIYLYYTLFHKHKVLVGTCQDCGQETLFNRPDDGSLEPDFDKPWTS